MIFGKDALIKMVVPKIKEFFVEKVPTKEFTIAVNDEGVKTLNEHINKFGFSVELSSPCDPNWEHSLTIKLKD